MSNPINDKNIINNHDISQKIIISTDKKTNKHRYTKDNINLTKLRQQDYYKNLLEQDKKLNKMNILEFIIQFLINTEFRSKYQSYRRAMENTFTKNIIIAIKKIPSATNTSIKDKKIDPDMQSSII